MPDDFMGGEMVRLTFRAKRSPVPVWCRVRRLLKIAGRALQLECTEAVDVTPYPFVLPADGEETGGCRDPRPA
jgi:hypothetical protein